MINKVVIFFLLFVSFDGLTSCNHQKKLHKMEAVEVQDISPLMGETFYRVYYFDDLVIYQSQYRFDSSVKQLSTDSSTNKVSSHISSISSQWRNQFFIFHKDSSYGFSFDPYRGSENNLRLRVDSTIMFIKGTNRFDSFLTVKPDSIIWNANKSELKEVFLLSRKNNIPEGRIGLYYSKNLNHLKESFNPKVDNAKRMKLFKVEAIFNDSYDENGKLVWPSMVDRTEMKEIKTNISEQLREYINNYKEIIKKSQQ